MRIEEEEPHVNDEIELVKKFVEPKSAIDFKGFDALHNIVLDIDDELLCSKVQMEVGQMYDELQRFFETFQRNVNKLTLYWMSSVNFMHLWQMTPHDMFKQFSTNHDFCQNNCALNRDAYLDGRLLHILQIDCLDNHGLLGLEIPPSFFI